MALIGHNYERLRPDGDTGTSNWLLNVLTTDHYTMVLHDTDVSYLWRTNGNGREFNFNFQDFTDRMQDVDLDAIESLQYQLYGIVTGGSGKTSSVTLRCAIKDGTDSDNTLYEEDTVINQGANLYYWYGTLRTTWNGSDAWTETKLNGLKFRGLWNDESESGMTCKIYGISLIVRYRTSQTKTITTDTVSGIKLHEGTLHLKGGLTTIK